MRRAVSVSLILTAFLGAGGVASSAALGELVLLGRAGNVRFGATEAEVAGNAGPAAAWAPGADVHYGFTAGRLSSVQLKTSSATATRELLSQLGAAMGRKFGEADYTRPWDASADAVELHWEGTDTGVGTLTITPKAGAAAADEPLPVTVPAAAQPKAPPTAAGKPPAAPAGKPPAAKPASAAPAPPAASASSAPASAPGASGPAPAAPAPGGPASAASASGGPTSEVPAPAAATGSTGAVSPATSGPQAEAVKPAVATTADPSVAPGTAGPTAAVATASTDVPAAPSRAEKAGSVALTGLIDDGKFQELHFGSNLARIEGLRATQATGELSYFVRPGDESSFDGIDIAEVAYVFREGLLVAVALRAGGSDGSLRLAEAFDALLGKPVSASRAEGSATWKGDKVTVTMRLTPDGSDTVALVMSNPETPPKQP